jgi:predicted TPR repeat methyltransferase
MDLGCGMGVHLAMLGSLGWSVIGVDLSTNLLRRARTRGSLLVPADVRNLPIASESMECCVSVLALPDLDDVGPFFGEACRLLARSAGSW